MPSLKLILLFYMNVLNSIEDSLLALTDVIYKNRLYFGFLPYFQTSVEVKCQLDVTDVFIANLIACSTCFGHHYAHHQELKTIIQWLLPVVFRAVVFKLHT